MLAGGVAGVALAVLYVYADSTADRAAIGREGLVGADRADLISAVNQAVRDGGSRLHALTDRVDVVLVLAALASARVGVNGAVGDLSGNDGGGGVHEGVGDVEHAAGLQLDGGLEGDRDRQAVADALSVGGGREQLVARGTTGAVLGSHDQAVRDDVLSRARGAVEDVSCRAVKANGLARLILAVGERRGQLLAKERILVDDKRTRDDGGEAGGADDAVAHVVKAQTVGLFEVAAGTSVRNEVCLAPGAAAVLQDLQTMIDRVKSALSETVVYVSQVVIAESAA